MGKQFIKKIAPGVMQTATGVVTVCYHCPTCPRPLLLGLAAANAHRAECAARVRDHKCVWCRAGRPALPFLLQETPYMLCRACQFVLTKKNKINSGFVYWGFKNQYLNKK